MNCDRKKFAAPQIKLLISGCSQHSAGFCLTVVTVLWFYKNSGLICLFENIYAKPTFQNNFHAGTEGGHCQGACRPPWFFLLLKLRTASLLFHSLFRNSWFTSREGVSYPVFLRQWSKRRQCFKTRVGVCARTLLTNCGWMPSGRGGGGGRIINIPPPIL